MGLRPLSDLRCVSGIGPGQNSADARWEPGGCDTSIRWPCPGSGGPFRARGARRDVLVSVFHAALRPCSNFTLPA